MKGTKKSSPEVIILWVKSKPGQILRILDLEGKQVVDTYFFGYPSAAVRPNLFANKVIFVLPRVLELHSNENNIMLDNSSGHS